MTRLAARTPCEGLLPLTVGQMTLTEEAPGRMTTIAPYQGRASKCSAALARAHGVALPAPNRCARAAGAEALWFGRDMALLIGPAPDAALAALAALTDQSDAWAVARLSGPGARDVLARLTPLDLRDAVFGEGHTARSLLGHMAASITRVGPQEWRLMVFRSHARSFVHEVKTAMQGVAARGSL